MLFNNKIQQFKQMQEFQDEETRAHKDSAASNKATDQFKQYKYSAIVDLDTEQISEVMHLIKLYEIYTNKSPSNVLDSIIMFPVILQLLSVFIKQSQPILQIYLQIVSNFLNLTQFQEIEDGISLSTYADMLLILCSNKKQLKSLDLTLSIIQSAIDLYSYICFESRKLKDMQMVLNTSLPQLEQLVFYLELDYTKKDSVNLILKNKYDLLISALEFEALKPQIKVN